MNRRAMICLIFIIIIVCLISLLLIEARYFAFQGGMNDAAMNYLTHYGYRDEGMSIENSVKMFQKFAHLPETGIMDNETMAKMKLPRCGNKEDLHIWTNSQLQTTENSTVAVWGKKILTYSIENLPKSGMDLEITQMTIRRAFDLWENVSDLQFMSQLAGTEDTEADIRIFFVGNEDHQIWFNDNTSFAPTDVGKPIAHAFFPQGLPFGHSLEGDIHFDNDRGWTVNTEDGINLFQTCVHEIGHAIGLRHSSIEDSVMYFASREKFDPNFKLHEDDIQGIQNLYGVPVPDYSSEDIVSTVDDNTNFADSYDYTKFTEESPPEPISRISTNLMQLDENLHYFSFPNSPISKNILPYLNHCNYLYQINNRERAQACVRILTRHIPGLFSNS